MNFNLEETPKLEETPIAEYQEPKDPPLSGNMLNCYTCGRSFKDLDQNAIVRRDYEHKTKVPSGHPRGYSTVTSRYFLTLCWWCDHQHLKP